MIKKRASAILPAISCLALFSILLPGAFRLQSEEKPKREVIQAQAMGQHRGRWRDYDLSGIELNIAGEQKKSDGALIVAGKFKVDKNQDVTFDSYGSGLWRLTNVMER
jgi:hypothetical protein